MRPIIALILMAAVLAPSMFIDIPNASADASAWVDPYLPEAPPNILVICDFNNTNSGFNDRDYWEALCWPEYTDYRDVIEIKNHMDILHDYDYIVFSASIVPRLYHMGGGPIKYADLIGWMNHIADSPRGVTIIHGFGGMGTQLLASRWVTGYPSASWYSESFVAKPLVINDTSDPVFYPTTNDYTWNLTTSAPYALMNVTMGTGWTKTEIGHAWNDAGKSGSWLLKFTKGSANFYWATDVFANKIPQNILFMTGWLMPSRYPAITWQVDDSPHTLEEVTNWHYILTNYPYFRPSWAVSTGDEIEWVKEFASYDEHQLLFEGHGHLHHEPPHENLDDLTYSQTMAWFSKMATESRSLGERYDSIRYFFVSPQWSNNSYVDPIAKELGYVLRVQGNGIGGEYSFRSGDYRVVTVGYYSNNNYTQLARYLGSEYLIWGIGGNYFGYNGPTNSSWPKSHALLTYDHIWYYGSYMNVTSAMTSNLEVNYRIGMPFATNAGLRNGEVAYDIRTGSNITYANHGSYAEVTSANEMYLRFDGVMHSNSNTIRSANLKWTWVYLPAGVPIRVSSDVEQLGGYPSISDIYAKLTPVSCVDRRAEYLVSGEYRTTMDIETPAGYGEPIICVGDEYYTANETVWLADGALSIITEEEYRSIQFANSISPLFAIIPMVIILSVIPMVMGLGKKLK